MKFTVPIVVGLCMAAILEVTVARAIGSVRACKPKVKHDKPAGGPEPPRVPEHHTCKGVECPEGEVCRLERVQCLVEPCPSITTCVPKDQSGEWVDSEEDWIDDPDGQRNHENTEEDELAEPLPNPDRRTSGPVVEHGKHRGGPVPRHQAPIHVQAPRRGDRTPHPRTIVIRLITPRSRSPRNSRGLHTPDDHKSPIPNSGEVPVGTQIPQGPNPGPEISESIPHHGANPGGPLIPVGPSDPPHDGEHGIPEDPENPYHGVNPGGPLIPVGPTEPDHDGERGGVDIPEGPHDSVPGSYPESPIIRRGQNRDELGWEESALHPEETYGAGPSFEGRPPKVRACRTPKGKHRNVERPK